MHQRILFIAALFLAIWGQAQDSGIRFVENKGQWPDQVVYKSGLPAGSCYLEKDRFTFNFLDSEQLFRRYQAHAGNEIEKPLENELRGHAYQVLFRGCQVAQVTSKGPSKDYFNYFIGNDPSKWASFARAYDRITLDELYPNIDLEVYSKGERVKYDFIVEPGGNPGDIQLQYQGVRDVKIKKGQLVVKTTVNEIIEAEPFAYQVIDGTIHSVDCSYLLDDNRVTFSITGQYNPALDLVIDPELIFSTYSGSTADNFGYTATFDNEGFLYSGSSIFANGYPTTIGAYQTTWAGGSGQGSITGTDIGITKYDTTGTALVYSTYIGGSSDELPHSLIVNEDGELYMYGTTSSLNYPTSTGAFQETFVGGSSFAPQGVGVDYINGSDIVVSKLSADGTDLPSSTFIGGSGNDGVNTNNALKFNYADEMRGEILFDADGNVIVASSTFSSDFPITPDAYQPTIGGNQDGCIVKLDSELTTILHGTYLGGMQGDATYSVSINSNEDVVVSGGTASTNFPTTVDVISPNFMGGTADGYVTILNSDLTNVLHSTYYGSDQYDQFYFVEVDSEDNVYGFGQTRAEEGTLIENANYNVTNGGMLVSKLNPDLSDIMWSTRFGNGESVAPNLSPTAFLVDVCNKIYLSGWGGLTNLTTDPITGDSLTGFTTGLPVTSDAYQSTTDGSDFYIMVLEEDASEIFYASFFGGSQSTEHVDGGTSRFDRSGKIYQSVCAGCGSNDDFPSFPPNAWSDTNNSNNCNNGVFKFDFDLPITVANFSVDDVCLPENISISNLSSGATGYTWAVNGNEVSNESNPDLNITEPGTYVISLSAFSPETCNMMDSISQVVSVYPAVELDPIEDINLCDPEDIILTANSSGTATTFHWSTQPDFSDQINPSDQDSTVAVDPTGTTIYYVQISNGFCEEETSVSVTPAPQSDLQLEGETGCDGDTLQINLENLTPEINFDDISWSPTSSILTGQGTDQVTFITDGEIQINVAIETSNNCRLLDSLNIFTASLDLTVSNDTTLCDDSQSATLTASSLGTTDDYTWSLNPDFSDPINPNGDSTITVSPQETTTYYVQAQNGPCIRTEEVEVIIVSGSLQLDPESVICSGDTLEIEAVNLTPSIELSYEWSPEEEIISGINTSTITVSPEETTVYEVFLTTEDGCTFSQNTVVYVSDLGASPIAATVDPNTIPEGESAVLNAIPNNPDYLYAWTPTDGLESPNAPTTVATPDETTTYTVTIFDGSFEGGNCQLSASVELRVYDFVCGPPNLFLPNAFSPNGDGNNDVLYLRGDNITRMHLAIYNRWGELVFETRDQEVGWDGTYRGKDVDPAVFVYHLEADCVDGQRFIDKGNVTVIR